MPPRVFGPLGPKTLRGQLKEATQRECFQYFPNDLKQFGKICSQTHSQLFNFEQRKLYPVSNWHDLDDFIRGFYFLVFLLALVSSNVRILQVSSQVVYQSINHRNLWSIVFI